MECLVQALFEIGCGLFLELISALLSGGTVTTYVKSKPNRAARKEAASHGETPPPRDRWLIAFVVILPITVTLLILLVYKYTRGS